MSKQQENNAQSKTVNKIEFPDYLGYGIADKESFREEDGKYLQDYLLHGKKVLTASLTDDRAEIEEHWEGTNLGYTTYPTLAKAVCVHYNFMDQSQSPIHEFWAHSLSKLGNIYVEYLKDGIGKPIFFPAVYMMTVRIPVTEHNRESAQIFLEDPLLKFLGYRFYPTKFIISKDEGGTSQRSIYLLEVTAPLAFIHDVCSIALSYNVILKERIHRAFVMAGPYTDGLSLKMWKVEEGDDERMYGVMIKSGKEIDGVSTSVHAES